MIFNNRRGVLHMAINTNGVLLKNVVADFPLQVAYASTDFNSVTVRVEEVSRPGLPLAGFFDHFESTRVQVVGNVE
jgi:HPr kinase/phosphorylase